MIHWQEDIMHSFHFVPSCFTVLLSEGGDAVGYAAHRTVGTWSTRVCCDHWLEQTSYKAIVKLLDS